MKQHGESCVTLIAPSAYLTLITYYLLLITYNLLLTTLITYLTTSKFCNKPGPEVTNNIPKIPPFCSFTSFLVV